MKTLIVVLALVTSLVPMPALAWDYYGDRQEQIQKEMLEEQRRMRYEMEETRRILKQQQEEESSRRRWKLLQVPEEFRRNY